MAGNEPINAKWLRGLKFKTSEGRVAVDENGKKKTKFIPVERALKPEDVLDWKDVGNAVVIVAKDGQKHRVEKEEPDPKGKTAKGGDAGAA